MIASAMPTGIGDHERQLVDDPVKGPAGEALRQRHAQAERQDQRDGRRNERVIECEAKRDPECLATPEFCEIGKVRKGVDAEPGRIAEALQTARSTAAPNRPNRTTEIGKSPTRVAKSTNGAPRRPSGLDRQRSCFTPFMGPFFPRERAIRPNSALVWTRRRRRFPRSACPNPCSIYSSQVASMISTRRSIGVRRAILVSNRPG